MKIPKKLQVGGHVVLVERTGTENMVGNTGLASYDRSLIRLVDNDETSESVLAETLLHEILHLVDSMMGTSLSEDQVARLSEGLFSIFRQNALDFRKPHGGK